MSPSALGYTPEEIGSVPDIPPIRRFLVPDKHSSAAKSPFYSLASDSTFSDGTSPNISPALLLTSVGMCRYKLRGIRNIIFYAPPDHPQFYTEYLSYPFLDSGVEPSDVTCRVIYSRYDFMRLECIAGTEGAAELIRRGP